MYPTLVPKPSLEISIFDPHFGSEAQGNAACPNHAFMIELCRPAFRKVLCAINCSRIYVTCMRRIAWTSWKRHQQPQGRDEPPGRTARSGGPPRTRQNETEWIIASCIFLHISSRSSWLSLYYLECLSQDLGRNYRRWSTSLIGIYCWNQRKTIFWPDSIIARFSIFFFHRVWDFMIW